MYLQANIYLYLSRVRFVSPSAVYICILSPEVLNSFTILELKFAGGIK